MIIPNGAIVEQESSSKIKVNKNQKKKSQKHKSKTLFDELLGDLEEYEDGCENRSLMDST